MTCTPNRGPAARRARLTLIALETREGPSSLTGSDGTDLLAQLPGVSPTGGAPLPGVIAPPVQNQPPTISGFRAIVGANGRVTFTGTVTDDQPVAGLVVTITGGGVTATAIVADDGTFRVTTTVVGTAPVTVTATTTDAFGATSNPVQTIFTPTP
jgi:hypothetical protein